MEVRRRSQPLLDFGMFVCGIVLRDQMDFSAFRCGFVNHAHYFSATPDAGAGRRSCAASSDGRFQDLLLVCRGMRSVSIIKLN